MEAAADRFYAASVSSCQGKLVWFWITRNKLSLMTVVFMVPLYFTDYLSCHCSKPPYSNRLNYFICHAGLRWSSLTPLIILKTSLNLQENKRFSQLGF